MYYIYSMKKKILISIDEDLILIMNSLHLKKTSYINELLRKKLFENTP